MLGKQPWEHVVLAAGVLAVGIGIFVVAGSNVDLREFRAVETGIQSLRNELADLQAGFNLYRHNTDETVKYVLSEHIEELQDFTDPIGEAEDLGVADSEELRGFWRRNRSRVKWNVESVLSDPAIQTARHRIGVDQVDALRSHLEMARAAVEEREFAYAHAIHGYIVGRLSGDDVEPVQLSGAEMRSGKVTGPDVLTKTVYNGRLYIFMRDAFPDLADMRKEINDLVRQAVYGAWKILQG